VVRLARRGTARGTRRGSKDLIEYGRTVIASEARAIGAVTLGEEFAEAVRLILGCKGRVVVTGMGKPGFVAQKISATLASTGTPSLYVHPAEAAHGDLGRIAKDDVVLALSNSGETEEILRLLPALKKMGVRIVALTRDRANPLARGAHLVVPIGNVEEACPMGLAPTASTAVLLALGDALAMTVLANRPFDREEYALFHPGGKLGRGLMKVHELMRQGDENPVVREDQPLFAAVAVMTETAGRPGAASVVDASGRLAGIFTDGDLRRRIDRVKDLASVRIDELMTRMPRTIGPDKLAIDCVELMETAPKVTQLLVVDERGRLVGALHLHDLFRARIV
jgi:arabinose-5-phosphate isomerase